MGGTMDDRPGWPSRPMLTITVWGDGAPGKLVSVQGSADMGLEVIDVLRAYFGAAGLCVKILRESGIAPPTPDEDRELDDAELKRMLSDNAAEATEQAAEQAGTSAEAAPDTDEDGVPLLPGLRPKSLACC